jgi:hypothetical protein
MVEVISALVIGAAIGLLEFVFLQDLFSMLNQKFLHCFQAIIFASAFVFLAVNPAFIAETIPLFASSEFFSAGIGLQIVGAVLIIVKGTLILILTGHSHYLSHRIFLILILGGLVFASPYAVPFILSIFGGKV